jgi:enoyl-CoA hydratase/carnithine racemase
VTAALHGGVAVLTIDNPPVNVLDLRVRNALATALDQLTRDRGVKAIVLTGAGRTFIGGADIRELERAVWDHAVEPPDFHELLRLVEDCPRPIVMAINGTALGGGLELAMAGHYRVAAPTARLGMPEVNLGIIPGAEGTQRLTRLVGAEKALEMCVSGKPIDAEDASRCGLVDFVVEGDFVAGALAFARDVARRDPPHPRTRARTDKLGDPLALDSLLLAAREKARKTRRHQQAPLAAVEAIAAAATLPFDEGCRRERALSLECVRSEQARAMVHGFFAERDAARSGATSTSVAATEIHEVAVVGAGTMGTGIAINFLNAGIPVTILEMKQEALDRGVAAIRKVYEETYPPSLAQELRAGALAKRHEAGAADGKDGEDGGPGEAGQDRRVVVPYWTFRRAFPNDLNHGIRIEAYPGRLPEAIDQARTALRRSRKLSFDKEDNFSYNTAASIIREFHNIVGAVALVTMTLSGVGLLVGGVGVMNIMLVSVTERTREIGVRKAIGASRRDIIWQFLFEAMALTVAGGLVGVLAGILISMGIRSAMPALPAYVPPWAIVLGVSVAASVGLFFGIYPAVKAAKLDPVDALRYE